MYILLSYVSLLTYLLTYLLTTISYGSRSFAVSGPRVWNDLPLTLHSLSTTLGQFQSRLKTMLNLLGLWDVTRRFHERP